MNPKYPVYIVSKGRWKSRLTAKALELLQVPYYIVIEPQEYDNYSAVISPKKILVLPFSDLGRGSIPARNWIWRHAISLGVEKHWILDDNIRVFYRFNRNKIPVADGTIFKCAEDFTDRFENIAIAGFQYDYFFPVGGYSPPFRMNTRIYSCTLIKNNIPYRWRGIYNEDTDLLLRVLKNGWCTILFYAFLARKTTTLTMKGGNTDVLYKDDGRLKMAKELMERHPDITTISWKWGRWQHLVDYSLFKKNKLIRKKGIFIPQKINNYGMKLIKI